MQNFIFCAVIFEDVVRSLSIMPDKYYLSNTENLSDALEIGNKKFENHPNVYAIRQNDPIN